MKWHKRDSNESEKPHVVELMQRHGWRGYFFWSHLNDMLARYFNFWCPGSYKFKTSIFYAFFYPHIKDKRTIRKMMSYLNEEGIVFSLITGHDIYIRYSGMEEKAREHTRKQLLRAKEKGIEEPNVHQNVHFMCTQMLPFHANAIPSLARRCAEDKEFRSKLVRTKGRTSSPDIASLLLETNNNLDTKGEDRGNEEEREGNSSLGAEVKEKSKPKRAKKPKVDAGESAFNLLSHYEERLASAKNIYGTWKKQNPGKKNKEFEEHIKYLNGEIAGCKNRQGNQPAGARP